MTTRLDADLVARGLARSRAEARDLIRDGLVRVDDRTVTKAATSVSADADITVTCGGTRWVGRGAEKLLAALTEFAPAGLIVAGRDALDAGASTGGFTQVLLARGAARVAAVDVGHGQLAPVVAADDRVTDFSGVSVRDLDPATVGGPVDLLVADLSFISLRTVLVDLARLVRPGGDLVLLVKPQFEVGRERLGKGGIVRRPDHREGALAAVLETARSIGLAPGGLIRSPLRGGHGNHEYLLWLRRDDLAHDVVGSAWEALLRKAATVAMDDNEEER
ncbi:TlyA family RNA methyltransferase [Nostocoides jenkinsii]|uniref:Putative methyltransferase with RNA binding domain n=1 Tax=Nostocoides jenkinsii Ben 74 TaxID=1193518 RepID=A0A077M3M4_9MICO|nr:TlyA family RNA methyltransferase [Tetrasphaera jenkinsii]CCI51806.1 putative methyltransferase with RNA binding domain [Tetrasphaera jenkinsii Ben 74]